MRSISVNWLLCAWAFIQPLQGLFKGILFIVLPSDTTGKDTSEKMPRKGAGAMARWSGALTALPEDLGLGPSTQAVWFTTTCNCSPKGYNILFQSLSGHTCTCTPTPPHAHICTHTHRPPAMAFLPIFILGLKLLFPLLFLTHSFDVWSRERRPVGAIGGGGQRTTCES